MSLGIIKDSWALVVVKCSACSPSAEVFSVKFVFEKNENNTKEAGVGSFLNKRLLGQIKLIY